MKIAIFSDIHGNLPAFKLMLKDAGRVDQYISLGDVVDYGPWSDECVELLASLHPCVKLMGNHELSFIENRSPGQGELTEKFFLFCRARFSRFDEIRKYRKQYSVGKYRLAHTINDLYVFPDTKVKLRTNWIVGHSHYQFQKSANGFLLLNPGSVGQNRQHINVINYLLFDTERDTFEMKNLVYDVDIIIDEMRKKKYPQQCIEYYVRKNRF